MPIPEYVRRLRQKIGTELLLVPTAAGVIGDGEGRILLLRHIGSGKWSFPGGIIEPLETPANAIVREVWEETALHVRPQRILGVYGGDDFQTSYINGDRICFIMTAFGCAVESGTVTPDGEEIDAADFFTPAQTLELDVPRFLPVVLADLENGRAATAFQPPSWRPDRTE